MRMKKKKSESEMLWESARNKMRKKKKRRVILIWIYATLSSFFTPCECVGVSVCLIT